MEKRTATTWEMTRNVHEAATGCRGGTSCSLSPVRDDHDALTHYIGVQHDVTARVEAEARVLSARTIAASSRIPKPCARGTAR